MAIKFEDAGKQKIDRVVCLIYGLPGIGKTSVALTASKPVLLDFDEGVHRAVGRSGIPSKRVRTWADVAGLTTDDLEPFDTVVVDTIGGCIDKLLLSITPGNPSVRDYGTLKSRFHLWLAMLLEAGKDVILLAHTKEEQRGDDTVDRIVAAGSGKEEVYQKADIMGRLYINERNQHVLSFSPTRHSLGKNPGLDDVVVKENQPGVMAEVLKQGRENINKRSEEANLKHEELVDLRERLSIIEPTGEKFNAVIEELKKQGASKDAAFLVKEIGLARGLKYDSEVRRFEVAAKEAPAGTDAPEAEMEPEEQFDMEPEEQFDQGVLV